MNEDIFTNMWPWWTEKVLLLCNLDVCLNRGISSVLCQNESYVILMKFPSLAALEIVILTTSNAANNDNFIKILHGSKSWLW